MLMIFEFNENCARLKKQIIHQNMLPTGHLCHAKLYRRIAAVQEKVGFKEIHRFSPRKKHQ
jgi:hypothetical protein